MEYILENFIDVVLMKCQPLMVKILMFSKTRVSLAQIDVTPNYRPSSYNSSFRQLVPALIFTLQHMFTNIVINLLTRGP